MRSRSGQHRPRPKHTSEVIQNECAEKRRLRWWNGERKSFRGDLRPHVFLFSFTLLFPPYVSFLIPLCEPLCPAMIWPQAAASVTSMGVSWRPRRQRGQSVASVQISVNIRSLLGQHQWCVQDPEATEVTQLVSVCCIKGHVLCFNL